MLAARGTPALLRLLAKALRLARRTSSPTARSTVRDLGHMLYGILTNVDDASLLARPAAFERTLVVAGGRGRAERALGELLRRHDGAASQADDSILADAAAGNDYVKVRTGARFSPRDIDILEVHEGWVHVATSLNGQAQPVAKWLAKGPPRTAAVQEGLAALLEMFTFRTFPRRARRLNDRVLAVDKAEDGASVHRCLRVVSHRGLRRRGVLPQHAPHLPRRRRRRGRAVHEGRLLLQGHRPQLRVHPQRDPAQPR